MKKLFKKPIALILAALIVISSISVAVYALNAEENGTLSVYTKFYRDADGDGTYETAATDGTLGVKKGEKIKATLSFGTRMTDPDSESVFDVLQISVVLSYNKNFMTINKEGWSVVNGADTFNSGNATFGTITCYNGQLYANNAGIADASKSFVQLVTPGLYNDEVLDAEGNGKDAITVYFNVNENATLNGSSLFAVEEKTVCTWTPDDDSKASSGTYATYVVTNDSDYGEINSEYYTLNLEIESEKVELGKGTVTLMNTGYLDVAGTGVEGSGDEYTVTGLLDEALADDITATINAAGLENGKTLVGWSTTSDSKTAEFDSLAAANAKYDSKTSLYAVYDDADVTYTVNVYEMDTDGEYPSAPAFTKSDIEAKANNTISYSKALEAAGKTVGTGFSVDEDKTAATIKTVIPNAAVAANVYDIYLARDKHTVSFTLDGNEIGAKDDFYYGASIMADYPNVDNDEYFGKVITWADIPAVMGTEDIVVAGTSANMDVVVKFTEGKTTDAVTGEDISVVCKPSETTTKYNGEVTMPTEVTAPANYHVTKYAYKDASGNTVEVEAGALPTVTKDNYSFDIEDNKLVITVDPILAVDKQEVTFDANGGSFAAGTTDVIPYDYGEAIAEHAAPETAKKTADNYDMAFMGWSKTANGTEAVDFSKEVKNGDQTYYAIWKSVTITFKGPDADSSKTYEVTPGTDVTSLTPPEVTEKEGNVWEWNIPTVPAANDEMEITGEYKVQSYKLTWTYVDETGATQTPVDAVETPYGTALTEPSVTVTEGYELKWDDHADKMPAKDLVINGKVEGKTVTITYTFTDEATGETVTFTKEGKYNEPVPAIEEGTDYTVPYGYKSIEWPADAPTVFKDDATVTGTPDPENYEIKWVVTNPLTGETQEVTTTGDYNTAVTKPDDSEFTIPEGFEQIDWQETIPTKYTKNETVNGTLAAKDITIEWTYTDDNGDEQTTTTTGKYGDKVVPPVITFEDGSKVEWPEDAPKIYTEPVTVKGELVKIKTDKYTVKKVTKDGDVIETYELASFTDKDAASYTVPTATEIEGYTFQNITLDGAVVTPDGTFGEANREFVLTYVINYYTVTYILDGAEYEVVKDVMYGSEAKATIPTEPTKEATEEGKYVFSGWTDENGTSPAAYGEVKSDITFKGTMELVADEYVLTFVDEDGATIAAKTYKKDAEIPTSDYPTAPKKFGYKFAGWNPDVPATMPGEDVTVQATYEIDKEFVGVIVGGVVVGGVVVGSIAATNAALITGAAIVGGAAVVIGAAVVAKNTHKVTYIVDGKVYRTFYVIEGAKVIVPKDPKKDGATFKGWSPEIPEKMPANDLEFVANFGSSVDSDIPATGSATAGLAALAVISSACAAAYVMTKKKED